MLNHGHTFIIQQEPHVIQVTMFQNIILKDLKYYNATLGTSSIKNIYRKPTANLIHTGEHLQALPLRLSTKLRIFPFTISFQYFNASLANAIRKGNKGVQAWKEGKNKTAFVYR